LLENSTPCLQSLLNNKKKGLIGEKIAQDDYIQNGFRILVTRFGSDFIASKTIEGKICEQYVEVKTGNARISKLQKTVMRKSKNSGKTYTVYRVTDLFMDHYLKTRGGVK